jgi:hypothetical protein
MPRKDRRDNPTGAAREEDAQNTGPLSHQAVQGDHQQEQQVKDELRVHAPAIPHQQHLRDVLVANQAHRHPHQRTPQYCTHHDTQSHARK